MATNMKRVVISVPEDIESMVDHLKQTMFYDKSYAEIYRQAIRIGLEKIAKKEALDVSSVMGQSNE